MLINAGCGRPGVSPLRVVWTPSQAVGEVGRQRGGGVGRNSRAPGRTKIVPPWVRWVAPPCVEIRLDPHIVMVKSNSALVRRMGQWGGQGGASAELSQGVKARGGQNSGPQGSGEEILRNAVMMNHFDSCCGFQDARLASITHVLWFKERASKMCSSASVRTSVNQETECVYIT